MPGPDVTFDPIRRWHAARAAMEFYARAHRAGRGSKALIRCAVPIETLITSYDLPTLPDDHPGQAECEECFDRNRLAIEQRISEVIRRLGEGVEKMQEIIISDSGDHAR